VRFNAHLAGENGTAGGHGAGLHGPPSERVVAKPEIRSPAKPETRGLTRKLMPVAQIGNLSVAVEIVASRAKFAAGVVARASRPCVPAGFHSAKTWNSRARRPCHYFGCGANRVARYRGFSSVQVPRHPCRERSETPVWRNAVAGI